jgi:putative DNA primase/helicase
MSPGEGGAERLRKAIEEAEDVVPEAPRPWMRELPPADPFPVDALGDVLAPAALAIYDRVRAPLAICGQSVLAAADLATKHTSMSCCRLAAGSQSRYRTIS